MQINLGDRVKDKISGLKGIVSGVSEFLYGCRRLGVTPESHKDGEPANAFWIDEPQAELIKGSVIEAFRPTSPVTKRGPAGPRDDHVSRPNAER